MDTGVPALKDAVAAIIGAGVSLAGLLLIFSGFLFAQAATFPPETRDAVINGYRVAARIGLIPFSSALIVAVMGVAYYVFPSHCFGLAILALFAVLSLITIGYGIWACARL